MQKSYLPLLISATVCGTLLADMSISGNVDMDFSSGSDPGYPAGWNECTHCTEPKFSYSFGGGDLGVTVSAWMETVDNDYTTANNRTTLALATGGVVTFENPFADTGMQPAAFGYGASVSHGTYDDALPDANTLAAKMDLTIPFGGTADLSGYAMTLGVTALTTDNFLDAGGAQNTTVGVGGSMRLTKGLTFGVGLDAGHTETDNGGNTDLVGAGSFGYSVVAAGLKYTTGHLTFNGAMSHTDTSETVGVGSSDSVDTTSVSLTYAVASGVTAIVGYTDCATENGVQTDESSAWYLGANMVF